MTLEGALIEFGTLAYQLVRGFGALVGLGTIAYLLRQVIVGFSDLPDLQRLAYHNDAAIRRKPRQWQEVKNKRATLKRCLSSLVVVVVLGIVSGTVLIVFPPDEQAGAKVLNVKQSVATISVFALAILGWIVEAWRYNAKKALDSARAAFPN